jgi:CheY-like chemotaxis protein
MARVLVIEDNADIRTLIRYMLKTEGHEVCEAENGALGVQAYRDDPADLVLLDMFMPEMDGFEAMRELRQIDPKVRIVAMTGGGSRNNMNILKSALLMGADKLLLKPFTAAELLSVLTGVLAVKRT